MEESQQTYTHMGHTYTYKKKPRNKKMILGVLGIIFVVFVAAFFSNPSSTDHKNEFANVTSSALKITLDKEIPNDASDVGTGLALLLVNSLTPAVSDYISSARLTYHNLYLASFTTTKWNNEETCVTFGMFGKVFSISEEKLAERFSNLINE